MMEKLIAHTKGTSRRLVLAMLASALAILVFSPAASAEVTFNYAFGSAGSGGGQLNEPAAIAQNFETGNLYVADRLNNRIQEFTEKGEFLEAWGFDVVESGQDNKPFVDEVQRITVRAVAGSFTLSYHGEITPSLPFNASAAAVQEALNKLPAIEAAGSVSVTGGPGDAEGTHPYEVTFSGGSLAQSDQEQITIDRSDLAVQVGTELSCAGVAYSVTAEAGHFDYRWLRDGQPIAGATSSTYTTAAADSGKGVQCEVNAHYEQNAPYPEAWMTNRDYTLVGTAPTPAPPIPPVEKNHCSQDEEFQGFRSICPPTVVSGSLNSPSTGEPAKLKCDAGTWLNSPTEYTYQWFMSPRDEVAITQPETKTGPGANIDEITLTEAELAQVALIQCKVTAANAGGSVTMWSGIQLTKPGPSRGGLYFFNTPHAEVSYPKGATIATTHVNGGAVFETCKANTNDVCKAGVPGQSMGQFSHPRGVAVDNSPGPGNGAVYVGDDLNYRVEKLSKTGEPLLEIGRGVNQTTGGNLCVVATGNECFGGRIAEDMTPGAFGGNKGGGQDGQGIGFDELGNTVAVDQHNGNLYVADPNEIERSYSNGRIQAFDSSGQFIGQTEIPESVEPTYPQSIAVDSEHHVPVTHPVGIGASVEVFDESEFTPEGTKKGFAERHALDEHQAPQDVSGDPTSNRIWIVDRNESTFGFGGGEPNKVCGNEPGEYTDRRALIAYDNEGHFLDCTVPQGPGAITSASGLAVSKNGHLAFVSMRKDNRVKVFKLPLPGPPSAQGGFVNAVTEHTATFHGEAAPGLEPTEVGIEFGTSPCTTPGACQTVTAKTIYGLKMQEFELPVEGLQPATKYYFRVTATNPIDTAIGPEHTFTTYRFIDLVNDKCPNALVRKQTRTAGQLDCRAYELASAGFAGGYDALSDLVPGQTPFEGFPEADGKVLYGVKDGGIPGTGFPTNHGPDPYVAVRDAASHRWVTRYVGIPSNVNPLSPPFSSTPIGADGLLGTFAFGGTESCQPCFEDGSSGIPVHLPDGSLVQGMTGAGLTAGAKPEGYVRKYMSDDGSHLVFGSKATGEEAIYDRNLTTGETHIVSKTTDGSGNNMKEEGHPIGELDVSHDGSRILFGKLVSEDAAGRHWKLYMNIGDSEKSVEVTPGTTTGVLYDGMSADGTKVFFSTREQLEGGDTDTSADIYRSEVPASGNPVVKLISGASSDGCDPIGNPNDWNVPSGSGKCDAVGLAGGAGVAPDGTAYFLSPQQLAGSEGEANAANLYVVKAGSTTPEFVATVDGGAQKPPPAPRHPVVNSSLISGLSNPESLAVDQSNGDIYVEEQGTNTVLRYTATGAEDKFTEGPGAGTNELTGQKFSSQGKGEIAVDSSSGVMKGNLYVTTLGSTIKVYSNTGKEIGALTGFSETCGVAVEGGATGAVYVADPKASTLWRFVPTSPPSPGVSNSNYSVTKVNIVGQLCNLSADTAGHVYASNFPNGPPHRFEANEFSAEGSVREGVGVKTGGSSHLTYVDPSTNELYVDTGSKVLVFDATGNKLKEFGEGSVSGYSGVAVNGGEGSGQSSRAHHAYVVDGEKIVEFGVEPDTYEPVDDPAVVHAVRNHDQHDWSDFQTSANGKYALFGTRERSANPSYDNGKFRMIYRYATGNGELTCVSCIPTEARPGADAALPSDGLGITEDGRAFFNSKDPLVPRDTNGKLDAYEWAPYDPQKVGGCEVARGCQALISTGYSSDPSSLLSVTNDGTDAFFFTREVLVGQDHNGRTQKIYDSRELGGFFELPEQPQCAASDECHGPSSQAAPAPPVSTHEPGGGNWKPKCKKHFVVRHGRCVRKPKHRHKHRKRHHKRQHSKNHRAAGHGRRGSR